MDSHSAPSFHSSSTTPKPYLLEGNNEMKQFNKLSSIFFLNSKSNLEKSAFIYQILTKHLTFNVSWGVHK